MNSTQPPQYRAAVLHGAGYVGVQLCDLLLRHPNVQLSIVTSRSQAGKPLWSSDPRLRGLAEQSFSTPDELALDEVDVLFSCAEHGAAARQIISLLDDGFPGPIVDLSADFRLSDARLYPTHYGFEHPDPKLLSQFHYALPELCSPYPDDCRLLANPGCFATGLALALGPLSTKLRPLRVAVTALTGASGSGARPKPATHYPQRDGSVSAYKVLSHQHLPEVMQCLDDGTQIDFVPVSGPWTRGIWGTAHVRLNGVSASDVAGWFTGAYAGSPLIRLQPGELPVLRHVVGTPFCDIGWVAHENALVVGFALDNLLKGAASQAVQNMNRLIGVAETVGLLPQPR